MYRPSKEKQIDMFEGLENNLSKRKSKILDDPSGWSNVFYRELYCRIDEDRFSVLYKSGGRPNASIKTLVSMLILKESNGWSDEQLFDNCRFNIRCMQALGQVSIKEDIPTEATYYNFRQKLDAHFDRTAQDLLMMSFADVTKQQIDAYNVKGHKIRLDSKLLHSNIRQSTRLELLLECIKKELTQENIPHLIMHLKKLDKAFIQTLYETKPYKITFPLSKTQAKQMLHRVGVILKRMLPQLPPTSILHELYKQQFEEFDDDPDNDQIAPRPREPKDISSDGIQSAHDLEATFRVKGHGTSKQYVRGYHSNITETCDKEGLNLIVDVDVVTANVSENEFLLETIDNSQKLLGAITQVSCDGGYDSIQNREAMQKLSAIDWNISNHKGSKHRYQMSYKDNKLQVYCLKTNTYCQIVRAKNGKFRIIHQDHTSRYFTQEQILQYLDVQKMNLESKSRSKQDKNLRANVESTIHHVFHTLNGNKTKYRGLYSHKMLVVCRCFWVNCKRIQAKMLKKAKNHLEKTIYEYFFASEHMRSYVLNTANG